CIWFVDLSDQMAPRLYLNEGIPNLRQALETEKKRGRVAAVRDSLIHSIIQPVLKELSVFAVLKSPAASVDDLGEWQKKLLMTLASHHHEATPKIVVDRWLS